ncbi:S-layer homology domain-containing protein [Paenibacillus sp. GSMTC-2017]|uniref:glycosyl hydrolase family 18 protein n=1 Tax=Paenibacillus sp. GSMTC-2017 TaxID=2794350 RepID=UPI0018D5DB34|nr:glycosyl hydrolase family 18 protein [Paenibacillus sp. GSMTC-2017]MBH5320461.1 S-layer homology domain-containing protein [Paenibacillus sp. GSMTC-2017]
MQKKQLKIVFLVFLAFAILISPLLNTTTSYANEVVESSPIEEASPSKEDSSVTQAVYGQLPPVPQNFSVINDSITATSATLTWDVHPDQASVDVWYYVLPSGEPNTEDTKNYLATGTGGSVELQNLQPNTTYKLYTTWYKRPYNRVERSNYIEFKTLDGPASSEPTGNQGPRNLQFFDVTHNSVTISYDPAHKIDHYWVWNPNVPSNVTPYVTHSQLGGTTIGGLKPETTYTFLVGPDGIQYPDLKPEQKSNTITFTTTKDTSEYKEAPLTPPHNVRITDISNTSITVQWKGSPDANAYDFYVNGGWAGGIWDGSDTVTYTFKNGTPAKGSDFQFIVGSQNFEAGKGAVKAAPVSIKWGELSAPVDLQAVTTNRTTAALGWAPTPGATSYDIFSSGTLIGSSDSNRYVAFGLTEGQTYNFTVVAKNALWSSSASKVATIVPGSNYINFSYYGSWMIYEDGRNYSPEQVDFSQITHINYAFSDICWRKVGSKGVVCENKDIPLQNKYVYDGEIVLGDTEVDIANLAKFKTIKEANPHLKLMASTGGWTYSNNFSATAASEVTRRTFANSVVKFLREYNFDGLDIDWEYPVSGGEDDTGHSPDDKPNFTLLMKTIREALDVAGSVDGKYYLLTIASGQADSFTVNADFTNSVQYLDMINIMTYDYSGSWRPLALHNSPLYQDPANLRSTAPRYNVRAALLGHLNGGVPTYKLNMGIPYYGKGWAGCPDPGEYQTCQSIPKGTWTDPGLFDFYDIENTMINKNGYTRYWNDYSKVAYVFNPDTGTFVTYNDETSMMYSSSLVKSMNLAGVMSWDISGDRNKTLTTQLIKDLPIDGKVNRSALTAPQNLAVVKNGYYDVQVKWDAVTGASGYEIFRNHIYVGYTTDTSYTVDGLVANTAADINVLAIKKEADRILEVSPFSQILSAVPKSFNEGGGNYTPPTTPTTPVVTNNELDSVVTKADGKHTISITKDAAIKTIQAASSGDLKVTVEKEATQVDVIIPKEVIAAIGAKGDPATITIIWNGVTYVVNAHAVHQNVDIKISISPTDTATTDKINKLAKDSGFTVETAPLDFKIFKLLADNKYEEITDFGKFTFSRIYQLHANEIDTNRANGVVYLPALNEFRPISTVFTKGELGSVTAKLTSSGNSIYTILESNFNFKDFTADWAKTPIERAAAKLIVSGETNDVFGANNSITRAELISIIVRGLGIIPNIEGSAFTDVPADYKYAREIAVAKELGIVSGKTATTFDPQGTVSRQELAIILSKVLKLNKEVKDADASVLGSFKDQSSIAESSKSAVALLVQEKILLGKSATKFDPASKVTKAQAVVAVIRLLDVLASEQASK